MSDPSRLPAGPDRPATPAPGKATGITLRAVLVGLALMPVSIYWLHQLEIVWYSAQPTTISLYFHVLFTLLALMVVNLGVRRLRPAWALAPSELLVVYIMLALSNSLAGHDHLEILVPMLAESTHFATKENRWGDLFGQYLPDWLVVKQKAALRDFYEGNSTLYTPDHLLAWAGPLAVWLGFITVLIVTMLSLNAILRKQWTERERLSYPIAQIPLEITSPGYAMWRSKLFWIGFGVAMIIDTLNGFAFLYPSVPSIPIRVQWLNFPTWPWTATGGYTVSFYPFAIGLGYLLPVDLLFSSWFFYWFWKAQMLLTAVLGFSDRPNFPYVTQQSFGGYIGLCLFALYMARRQFRDVALKAILGKRSGVDDTGEPAPYRLAFAGLVIGGSLLVVFAMVLGVPLWVAVMFFGIYFAISLAVTRMRAELGPPAHDLHTGGPDSIMPMVFGTTMFGPKALTFFSLMWWINRAFRSHPMPHMLEGMRIAERRSLAYRQLLAVMLFACLAGAVISFWSLLQQGYHYGWATSKMGVAAHVFGREPYDRLASWLTVPQEANNGALVAIIAGSTFSLLMLALRTSLPWWPLHPVGYAVSSSWSMNLLWMPMMIAWVIKLSVLRYGGLKLFRQGLPLFIGLILGEYVAGGFWSLAGVVLQTKMYVFWPY